MKAGTFKKSIYKLSRAQMMWSISIQPFVVRLTIEIGARTKSRKEFNAMRDEVLERLSEGWACMLEKKQRWWK